MDLLERYLQAIRKYLPWTLSRARQEDILAELRANYESQLEERESDLGRKLTEGEMIDWIKQLGAPIQVAARYQPTQYLIGPTLFPMYLYVLRLAAFWSLAAYVLVNVTLLWTGTPVAGSVTEAVVRAPGVVFTVAAWVTLIFAVLEYILVNHPHLLPQLEGVYTDWSPAKLAPLDPARKAGQKPRYFAKAVAEVIFGWLFLAWFLLVPKYPFLMFGPGVLYLRTGPFALASVWWTFYWTALAMSALQVLWNTADLMRGAWRTPSRFKQLAQKAGGLISIGVLLAASNHIYVMLKHPQIDAAQYSTMLNQINPGAYDVLIVLFLIIAVQFLWELAQWTGELRRRS